MSRLNRTFFLLKKQYRSVNEFNLQLEFTVRIGLGKNQRGWNHSIYVLGQQALRVLLCSGTFVPSRLV